MVWNLNYTLPHGAAMDIGKGLGHLAAVGVLDAYKKDLLFWVHGVELRSLFVVTAVIAPSIGAAIYSRRDCR